MALGRPLFLPFFFLPSTLFSPSQQQNAETRVTRQRKRTDSEQSGKREKQRSGRRSGSRRVSGNRPSTRARLPQTELNDSRAFR
uniref:Secreted protein n=1 Tax=Helianthus annuus TaxID=4232 RepID=A0A251VRC6_HELAN